MDESAHCMAEAARRGTPAQMRVANRLLEHPAAYRRWESEHDRLMRRVSAQVFLHRQVVALRTAALGQLHRKALFEYLRERQLTPAQRQRLLAQFYSFRDYSSAMVAEHGNYLRAASSYFCSQHVALRLMNDGVFAEPLKLYQERYADFFRVFCDVGLAQTDEQRAAVAPLRLLQPLLKLQLTEARREILGMAYRPTRLWREVEIRRRTGDTVRLRALGAGEPGRARELDRAGESFRPGEFDRGGELDRAGGSDGARLSSAATAKAGKARVR